MEKFHSIEYETGSIEDIRVVVGVDFGTTYSGFAYAYIQDDNAKVEINVNEEWGNFKSPNKTNTVLQYDEENQTVLNWGAGALSSEPKKRRRGVDLPKPVEYFKFCLSNDAKSKWPKLYPGITFEKAITDYLCKIGKTMKEKVECHWPGIDFHKNVRLVFTVPAEFDEGSKVIMRHCIYNAGLIKSLGTLNLQFTTEPEAASIYCMNRLHQHNLKTGAIYLVVDCGGGTVDLTMRRLLSNNRMAETTERTGDFCGSTYVDDEFLKFIESKVGESAMRMLKEKHYDQINYMVHKFFCPEVKLPFTGERHGFKDIEFDIEKKCPAVIQYVTGTRRDELEEEEWVIDIDFDTVVSFFDPVIDKILNLIEIQLSKCSNCSVLFLVGGFGESKYLQSKIRQSFEHRLKIAVPPNPAAAIVKGACEYGLDMKTVTSRVSKWTYGVRVSPAWKPGEPKFRRKADGRIDKFLLMTKKGTPVDVKEEFSESMVPVQPEQTSVTFDLYYTPKYNATYCDEPGMKHLGSFDVFGLPTASSGRDRSVQISLCFASMETTIAIAKSKHNGKVYRTVFTNKE